VGLRVAIVMGHKLSGITINGLNKLRNRGEQPAYGPLKKVEFKNPRI